MLLETLRKALLELLDGSAHVLELTADKLHAQSQSLVQSRFVGHGDSLGEALEPLFDEFLAA